MPNEPTAAAGVRRTRTAQAGFDLAPAEAPAVSGVAARELDAEVTRLLRVRRGELAEPLAWRRPSLRGRVDAVLAQLEPIRTHAALAWSWEREAHHGPEVRLGYAMAWLSLERRVAASRARRRRARITFSPLAARG